MRWLMFGLGWLALALLTARLVGGAAKLGGPEDPRVEDRPALICPKCGWTGDFGDAAFKIFVDDLESYCPECDGVLGLGPEGGRQ